MTPADDEFAETEQRPAGPPLGAEHLRRQLETIASNATLALFIMDEHQHCTYMNPAAERLTGYTLDEVQGRPLHDVVHHTRPDGTHYPLEECPIDRAFPENMREQGEEVFVHRDGSFYPVTFTASPIREGDRTVGTIIEVRDVREEKRAEAALTESESRFRTMADTAPVLIWTSGTDMLCDWFNKPWLDFTGRAMEQELGNGWAEGVHPEDFERCLDIYRTAFTRREPFSMEYRLRRHDGKYRWMLDNGVPRFAPDGMFLGYIGSLIDIHDQVEQRQALESANRAKSDFLAVMSHELRTPINAVVGYVDLMELGIGGAPSDRQRGYLERIRASSSHLLGLVNDVLDLSRIEADRVMVRAEPAPLREVALAAVGLVAPQATAKNIRLTDDSDCYAVRFRGDPDRVRQVLVNLLSNAVKFTEPGGVIALRCRVASALPAGTALEGAGPWIGAVVEDTGAGIPAQDLERIFNPFVQLDQGHTRLHGGTGLGLAISRRLARLMGGDLVAESEVGQGSRFTLWLPALAAECPPERLPEGPPTWPQRSGEVPGLAALGHFLTDRAGEIARTAMNRLTHDPAVPHAQGLDRAQLEDHVPTFLVEIGKALVALDEGGGEPALMRDGSDIQRLISDLHGGQRARLGWSADEVRREYAVLREEARALVDNTPPPAGVNRETALAVLARLLERAERISLASLRTEGLAPPADYSTSPQL